LDFDQDFDFGSFDLVEEEAAFLEPVHSLVSVKKVGEEVLVKGKVNYQVEFHLQPLPAPF